MAGPCRARTFLGGRIATSDHDNGSGLRDRYRRRALQWDPVTLPTDTPTSQAQPEPPRIPSDHPGITELFALLAYGGSRPSPADRRGADGTGPQRLDQHGQHGRRGDGALRVLRDALTRPRRRRGAGDGAVRRGAGELPPADDAEHLAPRPWSRRTSATLAADFYREIADALPQDAADVVRAVLSETGHSQFVVGEVRARRSVPVRSSAAGWRCGRAGCWARPSQAQYVLAQRDELVDLVVAGNDGLGRMAEFFDRLQRTHGERMVELGLARFRRTTALRVQLVMAALFVRAATGWRRRVGDRTVPAGRSGWWP